ncbi:MerR family transcriptional regulator [Chloracidobacterium sp. MS 40/45]|uniref:MerR family transcriptional regulator n=1 Tax=Chloracidobacterium aggregatum TaxID=2851959 RepID=UPI001B8D8805|nr:MerR family transcriptional regulator [Chloracidobacterium aggregatum]QUV99614.1 MerR family transcriptional regulator [Chloracidobacterium sp. MS 40/45]
MTTRGRKQTKTRRYSIGVVAETFGIHEQTLRMYEREGLLIPSRSARNTRYYTDADLERLKCILNLTREMGVNLAGVQVILGMRDRMEEMHQNMMTLLDYIREHMADHAAHALVRMPPMHLVQIEPLAPESSPTVQVLDASRRRQP